MAFRFSNLHQALTFAIFSRFLENHKPNTCQEVFGD